MKKLIYAMALGSFAMTACNNPSYTIQGTVEGAENGKYVYLQRPEGRSLVNVDSAMVTDGKFKLEGRQDTLALHYLVYKLSAREAYGVEVFLENANMKAQLGATSKIGGTALNDSLQLFNDVRSKLIAEGDKVYSQLENDTTLNEEQHNKLREMLEQNTKAITATAQRTIANNINNELGVYMLPMYYSSFELEELKALVDKVPASISNEGIQYISQYVNSRMATAVGQKFVDFTMKDTEGKEVKLSDYIKGNKYTLIDFWASWCRPCRRSMPYLVDLYNQFHKKGFNIVGVSLDNNEENWKSAIQSMKLKWNHMSDLKGWQCEGAKLYGVQGIPCTVMVDENGIIVARDLHGEEIDEFVKKAFGRR